MTSEGPGAKRQNPPPRSHPSVPLPRPFEHRREEGIRAVAVGGADEEPVLDTLGTEPPLPRAGTSRKSGRWRRNAVTRSWFSARFTVQVA